MRIAWIITVILFTVSPALAADLTGKARVIDGDTIEIRAAGEQIG